MLAHKLTVRLYHHYVKHYVLAENVFEDDLSLFSEYFVRQNYQQRYQIKLMDS